MRMEVGTRPFLRESIQDSQREEGPGYEPRCIAESRLREKYLEASI